MRVGILGGAFDPPHKEHINICLAAIDELGLDRVILVPSGIQPHKASSVSSNYRYEMAAAAIRPYKKLIVDDIELRYPRISYASDILPLLQVKYGEFVYILGGDSIMSMRSWNRPDLILRHYPIAVALRGSKECEILSEIDYLRDLYKANISILNYKSEEISSTEIRARLEMDMNVNSLIPDSVLEIIGKYNLYSNLKHYVSQLKNMLSMDTFEHSRRTVIKAMEMNARWNLPYDKVFLSALLHDCAKGIGVKEEYKEFLPQDAFDSPVLHQFLGAIIAEKEFKIEDNEILTAIRYHTTGRARMTKLEMLIFVADMIEESRDYPGIDKLRKLCCEDHLLCFLSCIEHLYEYLLNKDDEMYYLTQECYNYYIKRSTDDY